MKLPARARSAIRTFVIACPMAWIALSGCVRRPGTSSTTPRPTTATTPRAVVQPTVGLQQRFHDEIVVAGAFYRIGAPVVTWMDAGGYDAYRTGRHFAPWAEASYEATTRQAAADGSGDPGLAGPDRYGLRYARDTMRMQRLAGTRPADQDAYVRDRFADPTTRPLSPDELARVRNGGWTLDDLRRRIDQFVLHYDVAGLSSTCFRILHDERGLSVHFMLDIDGTIYQTCDLKEATWHATKANGRSIGIEIANVGSYTAAETNAPLQQWYKKDAGGLTYIAVPERLGGRNATRVPGIYRPARNEPIVGQIRGVTQRMYDLTPQQYDSLIKLAAALADVFPQIRLDAPRGPDGKVLLRPLSDAEYDRFKGVLGHYHVQENKSDPGVALQWDLLLGQARTLLAARQASSATR